MSNTPVEILSDVTIFSKYAKYIPAEQRRETWMEMVARNLYMHERRFTAHHDLLMSVYQLVLDKKVLPSMRSLQFGGGAIERNEARIYNCAYMPIEHTDAFSELCFLSLGGTGVGYSVQFHHVAKIPTVTGPNGKERKFLVMDSIEGWSDAVKVLIEAYVYNKTAPRFCYDDIRPEGAPLKITGGKAPGPEPLRIMLGKIEDILIDAIGRQLRPIECHDICCIIADAVVVAGIRRAALISLFSPRDLEMLFAKAGRWYVDRPHRARANNSAVLKRDEDEHLFSSVWQAVEISNSGEPGIYWTNDRDWGTNPCAEIALRPYTFCNLVEINGQAVDGKRDFLRSAEAAATIATFQAAYTDFHYLRPIWKENTEEDALIGVGITGVAGNAINPDWLRDAAEVVLETNENVADELGILPAARTTTIKPSGTSSLVLGSSSGIHAWHDPFYIRRLRFGKDEPIAQYLMKELPEIVEQDEFVENGVVVSIPQRAPDKATLRSESTFDLLDRVLTYNRDWVQAGYRTGANHNNVSATLSVKEGEWDELGRRLFDHRHEYNGMSVLPHDGGSYVQAPFETITEEKYNELVGALHAIDLREVIETEDNTDLTSEAACAGGACEIAM